MAFEGLAKVKEMKERIEGRMKRFREDNEKKIDQGIAIGVTNGGLAALGYANERWGDAPKDDPTGFREIKLAGVPVDVAGGAAVLVTTLFGGFGKYDQVGLAIGNAGTGAFSYRLGAEAGRRGAAKAATTSGAPAQMTTGARGPGGGRVHHVEYAQQGR